MRKQIFLLAVVGTLTLPVVSNAQQWNGPMDFVSPISRVGNVAAGSGVPLGDVKLFTGNSEDPADPHPSQTTFRVQREIFAGPNPPPPGHSSGHLIEAITSTWPGSFKGFVLTSGFKMGLGTDSPQDRLNVHNGNISITYGLDQTARNILARTNTGSLNLFANSGVNDGPAIELKGKISSTSPGEMRFTNHGAGYFVFGKWDVASNSLHRHIVIDQVGDINMVRWHNDASRRKIMGNSQASGLDLYANGDEYDGSGIQLYAKNHPSFKGAIHFISHENGDPSGNGFVFANYNGGFTNHMVIRKDGKVIIGNVSVPTTPGAYDYKLYVERGILTERVKVAMSNDPTNWSDFVFDEDYKLMPLSELESYIEENNHLPEIPTTKEVIAEGLDLARMDAKLLQKVEELTLYMIQLKKENEQLRKDLNKLHRK